MRKIDMPQGARYIIEQLNKHGYEAYIVGGCVRDSVLGKTPNDWDITTSAKPEQVKEIFKRTIDTGIEHGTVTVVVDRAHLGNDNDSRRQPYTFEVTTYRVDGKYTDHRRPDSVCFTASLEEDLKRRDFTINAMAYNDEKGLVDIFGGEKDLEDQVIRCVGSASERFDEDALRILRAVRFSAQLGFSIEEDTQTAMLNQAEFLRDISAERIQVELTKLITSNHPDRLLLAHTLGMTAVILPEFDAMFETEQHTPYHLYNVGMHTIKVMENIPADKVLRYSALFHDAGKPATRTTDEDGADHFYGHPDESEKIARMALRRLKLDNNTIDEVCRLVLYHDYGMGGVGKKQFRRFLSRLGAGHFESLMLLKRADLAGQSDYLLQERQGVLDDMQRYYDEITENEDCLTIKELAIDGRYLMNEMGMKPGKQMGIMLNQLLERVLEEPSLNTTEHLKEIVKKELSAFD